MYIFVIKNWAVRSTTSSLAPYVVTCLQLLTVRSTQLLGQYCAMKMRPYRLARQFLLLTNCNVISTFKQNKEHRRAAQYMGTSADRKTVHTYHSSYSRT